MISVNQAICLSCLNEGRLAFILGEYFLCGAEGRGL